MAEEVARLRDENSRLRDMMEEMRVLLISYVNQCRCASQLNNRLKFNAVIDKYRHYKHNTNANTNNSRATVSDSHHTDSDSDSDSQSSMKNSANNVIENSEECEENSLNSVKKKLLLQAIQMMAPKHKPRPNANSHTRPRGGGKLMANSGEEKPQIYSCSWPGCDSQFRAKFDLKSHMWRHTGERMFACEWPGCDKRFPVKKNLVQHRETHGTKNYACDWPGCEYRSWYPQGVRAHRKRHTDERPHKCSWPHCEWTFRQAHHLKAHMLKHTGEKPFLCSWPTCHNRFQSRQAMRFHVERAHKPANKQE